MTSVSSTYISALEVNRARPSFSSRSDDFADDGVKVLDVARDAVKLVPPPVVVEPGSARRHEDRDRTTATFDDNAAPGLNFPKGFSKVRFEVGDRELFNHMTSLIGHYDLFTPGDKRAVDRSRDRTHAPYSGHRHWQLRNFDPRLLNAVNEHATPLLVGRWVLQDLDAMTRPDQTWFMKILNVQAAKTHLSRLLEEAVAGEDIVIAKAGRPYVRLSPYQTDHTPRILGGWEGRSFIADDFDAPNEELVRLFEGTSSRAKSRKARPTATKRRT
jgi:prevent-host-death family protein